MATVIKYWDDGSHDRIILESSGDRLAIQTDSNDTGVARSKNIRLETIASPKIYATIYLSQAASLYGMIELDMTDAWIGNAQYKMGVSAGSVSTAIPVFITDEELKKGKVSGGSLETWEYLPSVRTEMLVYADNIIVGSFMISPADISNIKSGIAISKSLVGIYSPDFNNDFNTDFRVEGYIS